MAISSVVYEVEASFVRLWFSFLNFMKFNDLSRMFTENLHPACLTDAGQHLRLK